MTYITKEELPELVKNILKKALEKKRDYFYNNIGDYTFEALLDVIKGIETEPEYVGGVNCTCDLCKQKQKYMDNHELHVALYEKETIKLELVKWQMAARKLAQQILKSGLLYSLEISSIAGLSVKELFPDHTEPVKECEHEWKYSNTLNDIPRDCKVCKKCHKLEIFGIIPNIPNHIGKLQGSQWGDKPKTATQATSEFLKGYAVNVYVDEQGTIKSVDSLKQEQQATLKKIREELLAEATDYCGSKEINKIFSKYLGDETSNKKRWEEELEDKI